MNKTSRILPALYETSHDSKGPRQGGTSDIDGSIAIFDQAEVQCQLSAAGVYSPSSLGEYGGTVSDVSASENETVRLEALQRLATDPRGNLRPVLVANTALIDALKATRKDCPGFEAAIDALVSEAHYSMALTRPFQPPPMLLLGEPGVGKTRFSLKIIDALKSAFPLGRIPTFLKIACNTVSDAGMLFGHPVSWKTAKAGELSRALVSSPVAQAIVMLDEIDKFSGHADEKPLNILLTLLEPENATAARDEFLEMAFNLSHMIVIATANDATDLPDPIKDRFLIITIPSLSDQQKRNILAAMHEEIGGTAFATPGGDIFDLLLAYNPRTSRRMIRLAIGNAAVSGRRKVAASDVAKAIDMVGGSGTQRRIGFLG